MDVPAGNTKTSKVESLDDWLTQVGARRLLLVADANAFRDSGAEDRLASVFRRRSTTQFTDFSPNPNEAAVHRGVAAVGDAQADTVIAIGGGTAIDLAKLISLVAAQPNQSDILLTDSSATRQPRRVRLVLIPTTGGTGSEATQFAVVYVNGVKYSVSDPSLLPDLAILDPTLTLSVPRGVTVSTGLDALSQSIESLWSTRSTARSIDLAEQGLKLGLAHFERCVIEPSLADRAAMMQAANLSGQAINLSRTTAPHALSYHMTIRFGIPHGVAVAMSVAPFMRYNAAIRTENVADPRGIDHVQRSLLRIASAFGIDSSCESSCDAMERAAEHWLQLLDRIGCGSRLHHFNVTGNDVPLEIAGAVNRERLANNPRKVCEADLRQLIEGLA